MQNNYTETDNHNNQKWVSFIPILLYIVVGKSGDLNCVNRYEKKVFYTRPLYDWKDYDSLHTIMIPCTISTFSMRWWTIVTLLCIL